MRRLLVFALVLVVPDLAAQQRPPHDPAATRRADLVELVNLEPTIKLDIRYAGADNFLGKPVYKEARAFLERPSAEAVLRAHRALLRKLMEAEGFTVEPNEWWHYNYKDWREYPILDIPFSAIGK